MKQHVSCYDTEGKEEEDKRARHLFTYYPGQLDSKNKLDFSAACVCVSPRPGQKLERVKEWKRAKSVRLFVEFLNSIEMNLNQGRWSTLEGRRRYHRPSIEIMTTLLALRETGSHFYHSSTFLLANQNYKKYLLLVFFFSFVTNDAI